jgi:hypothetical protein
LLLVKCGATCRRLGEQIGMEAGRAEVEKKETGGTVAERPLG